jgi:hypothetical protein
MIMVEMSVARFTGLIAWSSRVPRVSLRCTLGFVLLPAFAG